MKRVTISYVLIAIFGIISVLACKGAPEPVKETSQNEVSLRESSTTDEEAPDQSREIPACSQVNITTPDPSRKWPAFYKRSSPGAPIPVLSSDGVPDEAHRVVHYVLHQMLDERPCVAAALRRANVHVAILAEDEQTTDIPELADLNEVFPDTDWNERARALGPTLPRPVLLINVENLLQTDADRHRTEHILIHELSHAIYNLGLGELEGASDLYDRLDQAYKVAMEKGRWENTYASVDIFEYWAEGVQSYFDANAEAIPADGIHNAVNTREELREHDPMLYDVIEGVFGTRTWSDRCSLNAGAAWSPIDVQAEQCVYIHPKAIDVECESVRSVSGREPALMLVVNQSTTESFEIFWVAPDGTQKSYGVVAPRGELPLNSFTGHGWRARDASGECISGTNNPGIESRWFLR